MNLHALKLICEGFLNNKVDENTFIESVVNYIDTLDGDDLPGLAQFILSYSKESEH